MISEQGVLKKAIRGCCEISTVGYAGLLWHDLNSLLLLYLDGLGDGTGEYSKHCRSL